jgi:hypothetical protein
MFEAGKYKGIVEGQCWSETKNGTPVFNIFFTVNEALEDQDLPFDAPTQKLDLYLSEKASERTFKTLQFLGFEGSQPQELDPRVEGHHSFVGLEIEVRCVQKDTGYTDWNLVLPGDGNGRRQLDLANVASLSFGKLQSQFRAAAAKAAPKPSANGTGRSPF